MSRVLLPLSRVKAAQMPAACIVCGLPVDAHVAKTFVWRPPTLKVGFLISLLGCVPVVAFMVVVGSLRGSLLGGVCLLPVCSLPMLIAMLVSFVRARRVTVECPVCVRHRGYWAWRGFWTFAPLLVISVGVLALAGLLMTRVLPEDAFTYLFLGTAATMLVWGIGAAILQRGSLRAEEITADDIALVGVHPLFADLLRVERQQQKSAPDYGWDDYDPYPRRPLGTIDQGIDSPRRG